MHKPRIPSTGIYKFIYELEGLILNSRYLRNRLYQPWLGLAESDKAAFMRQVARLAWKYILGKNFRYAVARTIIQKKGEAIEVDTKSPLFIYMKKRMYKGDSRRLIVELERFAVEVEQERSKRKLERQRHLEKD